LHSKQAIDCSFVMYVMLRGVKAIGGGYMVGKVAAC
jgi:hypothetical protein